MAKKKSKAQIKRMLKRAAERGEEYVPPPITTDTKEPEKTTTSAPAAEPQNVNNDSAISVEPTPTSEEDKRLAVALNLKLELAAIQNDEKLRAKERRSLKRKAEAIAAEEASFTVEEMQQYYEQNQEEINELEKRQLQKQEESKNSSDINKKQQGHHTPYIVFVGQLAFSTTKEGLWKHIRKELGGEFQITNDNVKIRLLTDPKTKKSKGMAFVECSNPELLYACLRLHHSMLEGRRINVERSAGGHNKDKRQSKIKLYREQQQEYLSNVVDTIIQEHVKTGELHEGELDEGAVGLCKRHTAALVETAIQQYIEKNGRNMDNPSAYFTFLLTKLAKEQAEGTETDTTRKHASNKPKQSGKEPPTKKAKPSVASKSSLSGVDFSLSEGASQDMTKIFPSLGRGRGRGRGYM